MVQYCPRHAHGGVRIFPVEHVQINADRQGQHYDQHTEHDRIVGQIGLRSLRSIIIIFPNVGVALDGPTLVGGSSLAAQNSPAR